MKKAEEILKKHKGVNYIQDGNTIRAMKEYAKQFRPAEIIKNGNVNLKPIKTGIDWHSVATDFAASGICSDICSGLDVHPDDIIVWFKERIEKELNSSE